MLLQDLRSNDEVLQTMRDYTESQEPDIQRVLFESWNAQQDALKYGEIINVILGGAFTAATLQEWRNSYAVMVNNKIRPKWLKAMERSASQFNIKGFVFDPGSKAIIEWMDNRGTELAVNLTEEQHKALQFVLSRMQQMQDINGKELSPDELSRFIRPLIGMVPREAEAVRRFFQTQIDNGVPVDTATRSAHRYATRVHRHRAMRIARTELSFAYNYGSDQAVRQAQNQQVLSWPFADRNVL